MDKNKIRQIDQGESTYFLRPNDEDNNMEGWREGEKLHFLSYTDG